MSIDTTFPQLLRRHAAEQPGRHALREKRHGIWQPITWAQYEQRVRRFAEGLAALGFARGEALAVLGDNRPEWLIAELAAQSLGGSALGVHPDSGVEEVAQLLALGRVRFVVVEDQEQVDKLVELKQQGGAVEQVIYYDPRGLERYAQPYLSELTEVERSGVEDREGWWEEQVRLGKPSDVAILCPTDGTTGDPKLARITHANLLWLAASFQAEDPIHSQDEYMSFMALAWIGEQVIAVACALQSAFTVNFPESPATVQSDLREVGPHLLLAPPGSWERLLGQVETRVGDAGRLKRTAFDWGIGVGRRAVAAHLRDGTRSGPGRVALALARVVALRPVREQLGLTRIRRAYSGGGPLGADVVEFFRAIGVNLKQVYGLTESCGIAAMHRDGAVRADTVGTVLEGIELRIASSGEILLRSPAVFGGYEGDEPATTAALHDGWLRTGDAGYLDAEGQLVVADRMSDVGRAPDGTTVAPSLVESRLRLSPYVGEAVALCGDGRPYVGALLTVDAAGVGAWAQRKDFGFRTYAELASRTQVYDLLAAHIARVNEDLPAAARVQRFVLLPAPLDADERELTRTRKLRRSVIDERYAEVIAALYAGSAEVTISLPANSDGASERATVVTLAIRPVDGARPDAAHPAREA